MQNNIINIFEKRRTVKRFKNQKVSLRKIEKILSLAKLSPVIFNNPYYEFLVITENKLVQKISCNMPYYKIKVSLKYRPKAYILVLLNRKNDRFPFDQMRYELDSVALGVSICYAATIFNLGSWLFKDKKTVNYIKKIIPMPRGIYASLGVGLGYCGQKIKIINDDKKAGLIFPLDEEGKRIFLYKKNIKSIVKINRYI